VQCVYPNIEGTNHQLLELYYTVLQSIAENYTTYNLTPEEHIKLLQKAKAASSGKQVTLLYEGVFKSFWTE